MPHTKLTGLVKVENGLNQLGRFLTHFITLFNKSSEFRTVLDDSTFEITSYQTMTISFAPGCDPRGLPAWENMLSKLRDSFDFNAPIIKHGKGRGRSEYWLKSTYHSKFGFSFAVHVDGLSKEEIDNMKAVDDDVEVSDEEQDSGGEVSEII